MSDDWRIHATFDSANRAEEVARRLERGELEHQLRTSAGERVIVSHDGHQLFLYAGTREQAVAAVNALNALDPGLNTELRRWHPVAEEWEDPEAPLPQGPGGLSEEQVELAAEEDAESKQLGAAEYEVRIELPSHRETVELEQRLQAEGLPTLRRWRYLLIGAGSELEARKLAERLEPEVPQDSRVLVEGTAAVVASEALPNPFAVFGGLGV